MGLDEEQARAEIARRQVDERCRYYAPNGRIEQFLVDLGRRFPPGTNRTYKCILRSGNRGGKTSLVANIANYLSDHYSNQYFDAVPILKQFRRPCRGRIITTATAAKTTYDEELAKWPRRGQVRSARRSREFNSLYRYANGSEFDVLTFDQDPLQFESVTLNWAIVDEPMSHRHWLSLSTRFAFGGLIIMVLTEDENSDCAWYSEVFETPERLADDVLLFEMDAHANCREHGVRGVIPHAAFEDIWRDLDDDQLETRRMGKSRARGGVIYKTYLDDAGGHVMPALEGYYADCWSKGLYTLYQTIDPHDRKPWAIEWRAFFPNGKGIAVAEWPDESMRPFHKIKSWGWGYDQYAKLTIETEAALGTGQPAWATIMDPNYSPKAVTTSDGKTNIASEFHKALTRLSKRPRRIMFPNDAISAGHMSVKSVLGDPARGVTPDYYWMEHCRNGRWSMLHYGYRENRDEKKGLSEVPVLQYKDFADLPRYCKMMNARYIEATENLPGAAGLYQPHRYGNGRVGV